MDILSVSLLLCIIARRSLFPGGGLGLLLDSLGPSILVHATSNGDIDTVKIFLEKNSHQVYCTVHTGMHYT